MVFCSKRNGEFGRIQLSLGALLGLMMAVAMGSALATYLLMQWETPLDKPSATTTASGPFVQKPWGELTVAEIQLERPTDCIIPENNFSNTKEWNFPGLTKEEAGRVMSDCGLTPAQVKRALASASVEESPKRVVVHTDAELIFSLSTENRARLYAELASSGMNHYMQFPFCFSADGVGDWLGKSRVDPAIIERVRKLLYHRGSAICFSDVGIVMESIPQLEVRQQLLQTLSRQTAVLPRLLVRPQTDIEAVLRYWDRAIDPKNVRPLLESLQRLPEGGSMSMIYLLPPFARERLYTFPEGANANADCHWTSMNFFNDPPDDRFSNPEFTVRHLLENYRSVPKAEQLGDIVLVLNSSGNAIHSAVYLADDLVFTKNGNNTCQAWIIMHVDDLLATYSSEARQRVTVYRDKRY